MKQTRRETTRDSKKTERKPQPVLKVRSQIRAGAMDDWETPVV